MVDQPGSNWALVIGHSFARKSQKKVSFSGSMGHEITAGDQRRLVRHSGDAYYSGDLLPGMGAAGTVDIDLHDTIGPDRRDLDPVGDRHRRRVIPADHVLNVDLVV